MTSTPDLSQLDPEEQIKRNLIAKPDLTPGLNLPAIGPPSQMTQDVAQLNHLQNAPKFMGQQSGIASLKPQSTLGKIGKGILGGLDTIGSIATPGLMLRIPGTSMHHKGLEAQAEGKVAGDVAEEQKQQQVNAETTNAETEREKVGELKRHNQAEEAAPNAPTKPVTITMGDKTYEHDPATDTWKPIGPAAQKAPGQEHAQAGIVNGKPAYGILTPQGYVDANNHQPLQNFQPPPNYAQVAMPLQEQRNWHLEQVVGQDGLVHVYSVNSVTGEAKDTGQLSGSGQQGSRASAAAAASTAGDSLVHDLQANREKLGTLSAWVKKYGLNTPIADPELAQLQAELSSFAALQPAVHGFRSHNALETFDKIIGGLQQNPEATIAAIRGIQKTLGAVNPKVAGQGQEAQQEELKPPSEPSQGMKWQHRTVNGKTEWRQVPAQ